MEFFKCSIAGVSYGTGITEIEGVAAARKSQACAHASQLSESSGLLVTPRHPLCIVTHYCTYAAMWSTM